MVEKDLYIATKSVGWFFFFGLLRNFIYMRYKYIWYKYVRVKNDNPLFNMKVKK